MGIRTAERFAGLSREPDRHGRWVTVEKCSFSGGRLFRRLATEEGVVCHGVLWLLNEMHAAAVVGTQQLYDGLTAISQHPRCRLPKSEIRHRLADYAEGLR